MKAADTRTRQIRKALKGALPGRLRRALCARGDAAGAKLPYPHVSLFYWRPSTGNNFGDHLSKIIVGNILARHGRNLDDETGRTARLLAIGSIMHFARDGDVIWGSGVNGKVAEDLFTARRLDIRAVRGPLTAAFLRKRGFSVPDIYGDPGFLTARLFAGRFQRTSVKDHVFIPNLHDQTLSANMENVVSPCRGWNAVLDEVMKSRLVLASSLHGLIVAEAFGIPARYVRLSETETLFKYEDYFLGTGRENFTFARSIGEALEMGGMEPPRLDAERLLSAFPLDLWSQEDAGGGPSS